MKLKKVNCYLFSFCPTLRVAKGGVYTVPTMHHIKSKHVANFTLSTLKMSLKVDLCRFITFVLSLGATEFATFEHFPGFFCHKFTIYKPLTQEF